MAVTLEAQSSKGGGSLPSSPITCSITLGGSGQRYVVVEILQCQNNVFNVSSVSVGGVACSAISGASAQNGNTRAEMWGVLTSLTGAQTISVSFTGSTNNQIFVVGRSFIGVDTTTPVSGGNGASGSTYGTGAAVAITSASGDMTTSGFVGDGNGTSTPVTTGSIQWSDSVTTGPTGGDVGPGTGSFTHTWTTGGAQWHAWAVVGVNIRQASVKIPIMQAGYRRRRS